MNCNAALRYRDNRRMPERLHLGDLRQSAMASPMGRRKMRDEAAPISGRRYVMGYLLPTWQRPLVWTEAQMVRFMESAWLGLSLGTYTYNVNYDRPDLDYLLIDGQQRLTAVERYLDDTFPVFGHRWSEVTEVDRRVFEMTCAFPSYETRSGDEDYLRGYYDTMNFGGTPHTEDQRASRPDL